MHQILTKNYLQKKRRLQNGLRSLRNSLAAKPGSGRNALSETQSTRNPKRKKSVATKPVWDEETTLGEQFTWAQMRCGKQAKTPQSCYEYSQMEVMLYGRK